MKSIDGVLVVSLGKSYEDYSEVEYAQIQTKLADRFGCEVIVVPNGVDIKLLSAKDGVYHREKLGGYEVEIFAKTETELLERLKLVEQSNGPPKPTGLTTDGTGYKYGGQL